MTTTQNYESCYSSVIACDEIWTLLLQIAVFGVAFKLLRGCPWEIMHSWIMKLGPVVYIKIFTINMVLVGSSEGVKRMWQTGWQPFPL